MMLNLSDYKLHTQELTEYKYLGDTRPEFKMWGGASKSLFVLVLKNLSTSIDSKTLSCLNNNLHPAL